MTFPPLNASITIDGHTYPISDLTEFGFVAPLTFPQGVTEAKGILTLEQTQLEIDFRVRQNMGANSACTFYKLPIASTEVIRRHLKKLNQVSSGNEELEARSYDELASGITSSQPAANMNSQSDEDAPQQKTYVKSLATMALLLAMIGLAVLAAVFLRSRSSLSVVNSALVGNSVTINAKVEGEISEVLVNSGDWVKKGDLLMRLRNPEIVQLGQLLEAELQTAQAKVVTLTKQREAFAAKLLFAKQKLELDREVAMSELESAKKARSSALAALNRLKPFAQSNAITQLELDEVENNFLAEDSNVVAKENLVRQIDFSRQAADADVLIIGDRIDDELGRIETDLAIAQAETVELSHSVELALQNGQNLDVFAPRDGVVYASYRQKGEFIRVADELINLSYPGESWAAGQVTSSQAPRVLPGQPVKIRLPSMKMTIEGTVLAVGHRAMYSKGNYSADFRGANATDVPVKVHIKDLPEGIPAGLRLEMAIGTGFGVDWIDNALGYQIKPVGVKPVGVKPPETELAEHLTMKTE